MRYPRRNILTVTLLDTFLDEFQGKGHCVTIDSAHMGDTMGQIGREEWKIIMVDTARTNRMGAPAVADAKKLKVGMYKSIFWQHQMLNLCYVVWSDNNKVKTLSKFHSPDVLEVGLGMLCKMRIDGKRDRDKSEVPCPVQMKDYCETFQLIDKGGKSRTHNWSPKLVFRLWNMSMHNAYKIYSALHKQYTPDRKRLSMKQQCMKELTFDLLQRGDSMRERKAEHPGNTVDLSQILGWTAGRKTRSDAKRMPPPAETTTQVQELSRLEELRNRQKKAPWLIHMPVLSNMRGK